MTIVEFLTARLDEREEYARFAIEIERELPDDFEVRYEWVRIMRHPTAGTGSLFAPGSPSPAEVLADIAAKRAIVADYEMAEQREQENARKFARLATAPFRDPVEFTAVKRFGWELKGQHDAMRHAVCRLASVYSAHEDYNPEWTP